MKAQWPGLDSRVKSQCARQSRMIGQDYWMLQACVEQEVEAKQSVEQFKLKR